MRSPGRPASVHRLCLSLLLAAGSYVNSADATFSIVLANTASGEVGGAVASCVGGYDLTNTLSLLPGRGAFVTQGLVPSPANVALRESLGAGIEPAAALAQVTSAGFDAEAAERQYGIALVSGAAAGYTGARTGAEAADVQGRVGAWSYSAQGNLLTDRALLAGMVAALGTPGNAEPCDAPAALVAALGAVRLAGSGDHRCRAQGVDADSAHLRALRGESATLELTVRDTGERSATELLQADYDEWRLNTPCKSNDAEAASSSSESTTISSANTATPPTPAVQRPAPNPDANSKTNTAGACSLAPTRSQTTHASPWFMLPFAGIYRRAVHRARTRARRRTQHDDSISWEGRLRRWVPAAVR